MANKVGVGGTVEPLGNMPGVARARYGFCQGKVPCQESFWLDDNKLTLYDCNRVTPDLNYEGDE